MISNNFTQQKLVMEEAWYKEYGTFLMTPVFATLACLFIPFFHCEQGLAFMAIAPLIGTFSLGRLLAPTKAYYEGRWQKQIDYPSFSLASIKKFLLFAVPTATISWLSSLFLHGYPKELAMLFETIIWQLLAGICVYTLIAYTGFIRELQRTNKEDYKTQLSQFWQRIVPPTYTATNRLRHGFAVN